MKMEQSVLKRRHIKFRRWGITQKKVYIRVSPLFGTSADASDAQSSSLL
jgi:hypothetical protein